MGSDLIHHPDQAFASGPAVMQGAFAVDHNQMGGRNRSLEIHIRRPIVAGGACGQNVQAYALKA